MDGYTICDSGGYMSEELKRTIFGCGIQNGRGCGQAQTFIHGYSARKPTTGFTIFKAQTNWDPVILDGFWTQSPASGNREQKISRPTSLQQVAVAPHLDVDSY